MSMKATLQTALQKVIGGTSDMRHGLDTGRQEIAVKRGELDRARNLPGTKQEVITALERAVDEWVARFGEEHGQALLRRAAGMEVPAYLAGRSSIATRRPEVPFDLMRPLTYGEMLFLHPEREKAALRAMIQGTTYEAGVPAEQRGPLIEKLERELATLEQADEETVDALNEAGIAVSHRPEVQARRAAQARADELAAQRVRDQEWIAEQKRLGHLGTPTVHHATMYPGQDRG